ncbi:uncharacterized protein LOC126902833 isoform X2 [Daktulosphaira vitifoliae]|nr:uncharacterized protein LOC126902833 isoform X2 [Daktulosphaira vitifoliae]
MLDELREQNLSELSEDLMTVNLYLNNIGGHLYMFINKEDDKFKFVTDGQILREGFKINYKLITEKLSEFLNANMCHNFFVDLFQIKKIDKKFHILSDNFQKCDTEDPDVIYNCLNEMKNKSNRIFWDTIQKKNYVDYHPSNLLLYNIMHPYSKYNKENIKVNDGLALLRNVKVFTDSNEVYSVVNLYEKAILNFDVEFIKYYHHQIIAATIHPVFTAVVDFLNTFNKVHTTRYYLCKSQVNIYNFRVLIKYILQKIVSSNLYNNEINELLKELCQKMSDYIWYLKPKNLHSVIQKMSKIMFMNKLKFNGNIQDFDNKLKYFECRNIVDKTNENIEEMKKYVTNLVKNQYLLMNIQKIFNYKSSIVEPLTKTESNVKEILCYYNREKLYSKSNFKLRNNKKEQL